MSSNVGRDGTKRHGRGRESIWEELSSNIGRDGKKKDVGGTSGKSILDLLTFHNKRIKRKKFKLGGARGRANRKRKLSTTSRTCILDLSMLHKKRVKKKKILNFVALGVEQTGNGN